MNFKEFYERLEHTKFKIFLKNDNYFLYEREINKVSQLLNTKDIISTMGMNEIKISKESGESVMKHVLITLKEKIQEFVYYKTGYILQREGTPGNWGDFEHLCIGENLEPVIAAIHTSGREVGVALLVNNTIKHTKFEDDDIYTNLYSILCENNVLEVIYSDRKLERPLVLMGMLKHYYKCKATDSINVLKAYLNVSNLKAEELVRKDSLTCNNDVLEALNYKNLFKIFTITTIQGSRLLEKIIKNPLKDKNEIIKRQCLVSEFYTLNTDFLRGFPDLKKTSKTIENGNPSLDVYLQLKNNITKIPSIIGSLNSKQQIITSDFIIPLREIYNNFLPLIDEISRVIIEDGEIVAINPSLNPKLQGLHDERKSVKNEIADEFQRVLRINKKVKLESDSTFKISRLDYNEFKEDFKSNKFVEISFLKTGVNFTSRKLSSLAERVAQVESSIYNEEKQIRKELKETATEFVASIEVYNYLIALIDVIKAFSQKLCENWRFPEFSEVFVIKNCFHPILKLNVVKNDISIDQKKFVVITGPNMGGKSTFIKTCGIIVLLAQIGCCVPADSCNLPIFDSIFVRIGAMDYPSLNISTFLGEMIDISKITRNATEKSLVLIDELGRGTSAIDGLCIATAVKEFLLEKNCITLFATHFPQLCDEKTLNMQVGISENGMLNYLIGDGVCDLSFGLKVAEFVGFPEIVIQNAQKYMEIGEKDE